MAKDSGLSGNVGAQDVDLDDIEVVILIVGKNASSLNQAASFLTRRGWPTTVMTNVSKAVEHVADKKPDFVLISFNHPSPAILKLPDLIMQTFNLSCVGFIENMDAGSQTRLNNFRMRHKIQGMPSGPNLHRSIRKILAEKFNIKTDEEKRKDDERVRAEREGNTVRVKGGAKDGDSAANSNMIKGEAGSDAGVVAGPTGRKRLSDISQESASNSGIGYMPNHSTTEEGGDSGYEPSREDSVSSSKYKMSKKTRRSLKDLTIDEAVAEASGNLLQGKEVADGSSKSGNLADMLKKSLFGESGKDASEVEAEVAQANAVTTSHADSKSPIGDVKATAGSDSNAAGSNIGAEGDSSAGLVRASTDSGTGPLGSVARISSDPFATFTPVQLLEQAVGAALRRICSSSPDVITRELGKVTKVAVFPLETSLHPGFLVVGIEQDPSRIDDFFLNNCENALREEFVNLQVQAKLESGFWIHVPEISFPQWIAEKGSFKVIMPHEEGEVGVGFLPLVGSLPKVEVYSENRDMLKIAVADISTEQPINFKAYLHLKKNEKYFLYLRNGRVLQPEQKDRLKGNQIENIFMKSVEAENLRMFLAASYLRDTMKKPA